MKKALLLIATLASAFVSFFSTTSLAHEVEKMPTTSNTEDGTASCIIDR